MVELEVEDYSEILDWFTLAFGKKGKPISKINNKAKMTFYKLNFLAEDKIKEDKQLNLDEDDEWTHPTYWINNFNVSNVSSNPFIYGEWRGRYGRTL